MIASLTPLGTTGLYDVDGAPGMELDGELDTARALGDVALVWEAIPSEFPSPEGHRLWAVPWSGGR